MVVLDADWITAVFGWNMLNNLNNGIASAGGVTRQADSFLFIQAKLLK